MNWFWPPVCVKELSSGHTTEVKSVEAAIEQMRTWPKVGPKMKAAYPICYGVADGTYTVDECRVAFEDAAKEAKVVRVNLP